MGDGMIMVVIMETITRTIVVMVTGNHGYPDGAIADDVPFRVVYNVNHAESMVECRRVNLPVRRKNFNPSRAPLTNMD